MTPSAFSLILASVSLSAMGQTLFKTGVGRARFVDGASILGKVIGFLTSPWIMAGLAVYAVGTVLWLFALKRIDLSLAYPFVAMSFIIVTASAVLILGETLTYARVAGLSLIVAGLVVMAFGS